MTEAVYQGGRAAIMDVAGKAISVIGMARSGVNVAELLAKHGARVFVSDSGSREKLAETITRLSRRGIDSEAGGHSDRVLTADLVVLSPGVPTQASIVRQALARGIPVVSEIEIASRFCRAPMIAITGTNGKTTTTTLTGRLFERAGAAHVVAGNIGTAFSSVVDELDERSTAVLEVSSFQLDHIEIFHPRVAVILNITPDHLDRYEHMFDRYVDAKCRIFEKQSAGDILIYNEDDEVVRTCCTTRAAPGVRRLPFSLNAMPAEGAFVERGILTAVVDGRRTEIIPIEEIGIPGKHNLYNAMAATLAALASGIDPAPVREELRAFQGVEHRLEFVRERNGVRYFNDSKATNVDSVWYALQAFEEPIVLLLGGRDKGNDYNRIDDLVRKHVKIIIAIGESAEKVVQNFSDMVLTRRATSMEEAVRTAGAAAEEGDVVLLSPACASFDWFDNYEHRGRVFKELVHAL